ncbi:uncharacterized protein LOC132744555 [Ruditapes philippinarum]|uniref:uncharacterized protein LOC132744555 n=1 Tax=Ruditapes philippinarum TaxID=129788 RepID=UPI00295C19FB|nr:uncharacterized protein LOC132744555 [Ruditapes philippinarum]
MESENEQPEKTTMGAPSLSITEGNEPISLNNVSPQTHQLSEFTSIRPKVRKTRAKNIDSLGRKATIKPEVSLKMPQGLAKEQEMVKQYAPTVQQEIRQKRVEEVNFLTGQTKKMKTFGNSPLQMDVQEEHIKEDEEESKGSAIPNFSMLLSN